MSNEEENYHPGKYRIFYEYSQVETHAGADRHGLRLNNPFYRFNQRNGSSEEPWF
jgi:hypothetical protein